MKIRDLGTIIRALAKVALAFGVVLALSMLLFGPLMLGWRLYLGDERFDAEVMSIRFIALKLEPEENASSIHDLVRSARAAGFHARSEETADGFRLTLRPPPELDDRRELLDEHGYRMTGFVSGTSTDLGLLIASIGQTRSLFILSLVAQVLATGVVGWWLLRRPDPAIRTHPLLRSWRLSAVFGAGIALLGIPVSFAQTLLGFPVREQPWVEESLNGGPLQVAAMVLLVVLLVPLAEELFFRGFVFRLLAERVSASFGYVVSACYFAVIHFNPSGLVVYFSYGMLLAWLAYRTGRLSSAIVAHVVINAVSVTFTALF